MLMGAKSNAHYALEEVSSGARRALCRRASGASRRHSKAPMPGRAMTGYVLVPTAEANDTRALAVWLQKALDFTLTLPKKASKAKPRKAK
jgi:hypothetical protein